MHLCRNYLLVVVLIGLQILRQHQILAEGEACYRALGINGYGVCVNFRRCTPYLQLLQRYGVRIGVQLRNTVCYYQGSDPVVCCTADFGETNAVPTEPATPPPIRTTTQPPTTTTQTPRPTTQTYPYSNSTTGQYAPLFAPDCGFSNANHGRVVGGVPAELGAWPWIAALGYKTKNEIKFKCGGSLISARHVLTAGHCVHGRQDLRLVRLGEHDIARDDDGANPIDVPIERATVHPEYSPKNYVNDIAVLRLKGDITFTVAIHPICLPIPEEIKNRNFVRNYPFIAGWGAVQFRGSSSDVIQEVQLPVVTNEACARAFSRFKEQVIDERVLCAGYEAGGKDACQGDSGGPLMIPKGSTYYAIGVVSFGYQCALEGIPGVYTRVTHFLDFILSNLN